MSGKPLTAQLENIIKEVVTVVLEGVDSYSFIIVTFKYSKRLGLQYLRVFLKLGIFKFKLVF